jgi:hypothetical protein
MGDWRKTQYRIGPPPDHLGEAEDVKYGLGLPLLIGGLSLAAIASVVFWLLGL